jgi:hypothetical protein|eukprot:COSAG02_NODE_6651_length_3435_cov_5.250899_4_plen_71_part_00
MQREADEQLHHVAWEQQLALPRFVSDMLPAKNIDGSSSSRAFVHVLPYLSLVRDLLQPVITNSKAATAQI